MNGFRAAAGVLLAATFGSAAFAADLPYPADAMPIASAPALSWTGIYGGVNVGYAWGDFDATDFGAPFDYEPDGPLVGGQVGANWQIGSLVLGVEGDLSLADLNDDVNTDFGAPGLIEVNVDVETQWFATLRGRVGLAWNRFMVYGTGGLAAAEMQTDLDVGLFGGFLNSSDSDDQVHVGWTVGGGVEALVTDHITVGLEYLHADLGSEEYSYSLFGGGVPVTGDADLTADLVRGKINVKF